MLTVENGTLSSSVSCAHSSGDTDADREVRREQRREEHQLAGQPHDRPDADHARPVVVPVQAGGRDCGCCSRHGRHYVGNRLGMAPRPPGNRASHCSHAFGAGRARSLRSRRGSPSVRWSSPSRPLVAWSRDPLPRRPGRRTLRPARVHARPGVHRVGDRPVPLRADGVGGRRLPVRRVAAAQARRPWPVGRTVAFVVPGMGAFAFATMSGLGGLRHRAAVGAHGPAHGAVDARAAVPGARRAGDARAAHPACHARGAGCWPCCTPGSRRC